MSTTSDSKTRRKKGKPQRDRSSAKRKATPERKRPSSANSRSSGTSARKPSSASRPRRDVIRDGWGVALLVVAPLSALGIYAHAAGLIGTYLELFFRGLFGVFGYLAPPALLAAGVALLRERRSTTARVAVGCAVTLASGAGLWHLVKGAPHWNAAPEQLHAAAGWLGATVALPLRDVAATSGAVVLLVPLFALGLLITTATPPRAVARRVGAWSVSTRDMLAERRTRRKLDRDATVDAQDATPPADAATVADTTAVLEDDDTGELIRVAPPDDGGHDDATRPFDAAPVFEGLMDDGAGDGDPDPAEGAALSDTQLLPKGVQSSATKLAPGRGSGVGADDEWADYDLPPLDLLRTGRAAPGNKKSLDQMTRALEHTLTQFGVDARVSRVSRGPTVTRFEIELGPGVKVAAVTRLGDDISYALATPEIRIVAPIPGKSAIGIEVPNRDRDLITLGDVLRSPEAGAQMHPLACGVGVDIAGNAVMVNLATMPHLLIAGATGSGKSVTMNSIVTSVIMRATPAQVRMILVDPKRVELNHYEGAPHLLTPVVTDAKRATEALKWTVEEMEARYDELARRGYRNVDSYNAAVRSGTVRPNPAISGHADDEAKPYPYIMFIIDELADLMMVAPRDVEGQIVRIAQMARAVGIHLIVATQRPSVDVVTGLIKANIPSRIALAMATQADSRTILDQGGAEKLVGDGDMLFMPANASKPHRIQGCYIGEAEIEQVVNVCKAQREPDLIPGIVKEGRDAAMADVSGDDASDEDLTRAAMELVVRSGLGSTSMLQRKLKVGFARAGRIMDELETMGVVGPSEGSKARQVLMTVNELESQTGVEGDAG